MNHALHASLTGALFLTIASSAFAVPPESPASSGRWKQIQAPGVPGLVGSREGTKQEITAIQRAFRDFKKRSRSDAFESLESYLTSNSESPWRISVLNLLGERYYRSGRFSKALEVLEKGWTEGKVITDVGVKETVDDILGRLVSLHARLGNVSRLEELQSETKERSLYGPARNHVLAAWEALQIMKKNPAISFRCGPLALGNVLAVKAAGDVRGTDSRISDFFSSERGTNLAQVAAKANAIDSGWQVAFRQPGAQVIAPSVVHWKAGHFAAIVGPHGPNWLVRDHTFLSEFVLTRAALDEEGSGYYLVPSGVLPRGWRTVTDSEAAEVWGKGYPSSTERGVTCPPIGGESCKSGCAGMPRYAVIALTAGLTLEDIPVWYSNGYEPTRHFKLKYNQYDTEQPLNPSYSNFGPLWGHPSSAHVKYDPFTRPWPVSVVLFDRDMSRKEFTFDPALSYTWTDPSQPALPRPFESKASHRNPKDGSYIIYEPIDPDAVASTEAKFTRVFPDGRRDFYEVNTTLDGGMAAFITKEQPQGKPEITYQWQSTEDRLRLLSKAGFSFSYGNATFPTRITKVTAPGGRFASFSYTSGGLLETITDMGGLSTTFEYQNGQVSAMNTPYGRTSFEWTANGVDRSLEITDPAGAKERVEFKSEIPINQVQPDSGGVPVVDSWQPAQDYFQYRNTFYWNKKAMKDSPGDYTKAEVLHWLHGPNSIPGAIATLEHRKKPLENRTFYRYPGQYSGSIYSSGSFRPDIIARQVLDENGIWRTQALRLGYDVNGNVTSLKDPKGRELRLTYDDFGNLAKAEAIDGTQRLLVHHATFHASGLPHVVTDAAGKSTIYTWNDDGMPLTVTNAKNETVTYSYLNRRIETITGAIPDGPISFIYDSLGRVETVSDGSGQRIKLTRDLFDRVTRIGYGTDQQAESDFEEFVYNRLDLEWFRNRDGGWTRYFVDSAQRIAAIVDPENRVTSFDWCSCGALHGFTDANGNETKYSHDVQLRTTQKQYADGRTERFIYEPGGSRLAYVEDAKGQRRNMRYFIDDRLQRIFYTDANGGPVTPAMADVSFTYDAIYGQLETMTDGLGTWQYDYHPPGSLGAMRIASIDGPLSDDTISYFYDELGRQTSRTLAGVAEDMTYDGLGRLESVSNALGGFSYDYEGSSSRVSGVGYPTGTGLATVLEYSGGAAGLRLEKILHTLGGVDDSEFGYEYEKGGTIRQWLQTVAGSGEDWELKHDAVDQLLTVIRRQAGSGAEIGRENNRYDKLGNRISHQGPDGLKKGEFNHLNQLESLGGGGQIEVEGQLDEAAVVTVGGKPASVTSQNVFNADVAVTAGTNNIPITATDGSGNTTSKNAVIVIDDVPQRLFAYDENGNTLSDGLHTYEWDAANQLRAITSGNRRTEIDYDGLGRRARMVEKVNESVASEKRYVWDGLAIAEERHTGGSVTRFFAQGFQEQASPQSTATSFYYLTDHLGSIRAIVDATGTVRGRWTYDAWGKRTTNQITTNPIDSPQGFTGHYLHESGLVFAPFRTYDPETARWLSRDPIAEAGGINLYGYVSNDPVNLWDPLGLKVFIGQHSVMGVGNHVFLLLMPDDGGPASTLGGYNRGPFLNSDPDYELSKIIQDREEYTILTAICPPEGMSDKDFIDALKAADASYQNDKNFYFGLPFLPGTYNSNSYITGLLNAVGLSGSKIVGSMPGWQPGGSKSPPPLPAK